MMHSNSEFPRCNVSLSYLEGMREAYDCAVEHGLESLKERVHNLERELGNPTRYDSMNVLRKIQGMKLLKNRR